MYRRKYVYICDGCGNVDFPQIVQRGDITDTVALPDGWRHIGGKHLCGECVPDTDEIGNFRDYIARNNVIRK